MKIAAIICEYNPFHNGHKFQIETLKREFDGIVAVMSGNFVQRGSMAIRDKWTRAEMALRNGVDLVIELPIVYAINSAQKFSYGGVALIESMGIVDTISFGSESGEIDEFYKVAEILNNEPPEVSEKILELLNEGMSYPSAREIAYEGHINLDLIKTPNNILGVEYVRALLKLNSKIKAHTIKRVGAGYNEEELKGNFSSATAIRSAMANDGDFSASVPENVLNILNSTKPFSEEKLFDILKYKVLTGGKEYIKTVNDVAEGLENKIYDAVRDSKSWEEAEEKIKSKRYTLSRIRRILLSVILGIDKEFSVPQYIRVLGMNGCGKEILKEMKKTAAVDIIVKTADHDGEMLRKDILATDIYNLITNGDMGMDFKQSPIII